MKISRYLVLLVSILLINFTNSKAQTDTVSIMTSSVCATCKKTIEENLSFEKGVKSSSLNVDTHVLKVVYDTKKTSPEKIRLAVTKIGYDADSLKADPKSFKRLPECCKHPEKYH